MTSIKWTLLNSKLEKVSNKLSKGVTKAKSRMKTRARFASRTKTFSELANENLEHIDPDVWENAQPGLQNIQEYVEKIKD